MTAIPRPSTFARYVPIFAGPIFWIPSIPPVSRAWPKVCGACPIWRRIGFMARNLLDRARFILASRMRPERWSRKSALSSPFQVERRSVVRRYQIRGTGKADTDHSHQPTTTLAAHPKPGCRRAWRPPGCPSGLSAGFRRRLDAGPARGDATYPARP